MSTSLVTRLAQRSASAFRRGLSTEAGGASRGPKLPEGNDPAAFHPIEHAANDTSRWRWISAVFSLPVGGFAVLQALNGHEHSDEPAIEYSYMRMSTRSPRFPWGEDDLIGTPSDRAKKAAEKE